MNTRTAGRVSYAQSLAHHLGATQLGAIKLLGLGRIVVTSSATRINMTATLDATALTLISGVNTYMQHNSGPAPDSEYTRQR